MIECLLKWKDDCVTVDVTKVLVNLSLFDLLDDYHNVDYAFFYVWTRCMDSGRHSTTLPSLQCEWYNTSHVGIGTSSKVVKMKVSHSIRLLSLSYTTPIILP